MPEKTASSTRNRQGLVALRSFVSRIWSHRSARQVIVYALEGLDEVPDPALAPLPAREPDAEPHGEGVRPRVRVPTIRRVANRLMCPKRFRPALSSFACLLMIQYSRNAPKMTLTCGKGRTG